MKDPIFTLVPGQDPIELIAYYDNFLSYYPNCEPETKSWFVDHAQEDWVILDCGANIGYYTILFSRVAPKGTIHAFEPTSTADMWEANINHHGVRNAVLHRVALGAEVGEIVDDIYRVWGEEPDRLPYPFETLDRFVQENRMSKVDCIKIDVDSFDLEVLRGARETLARFDPWVVVELNHALACRQQSVPEALRWMANEGYGGAKVIDNENFVFKRSAEKLFSGSAQLQLTL